MNDNTYAGHTLAEIKAAAEAATPGPWQTGGDTVEQQGSGRIVYHVLTSEYCMERLESLDAVYGATANPATVLAMAARIEELERDAARWKCWLRMATTLEGLTVLDQMVDALERCPAGHVTPETFTAAIDAVMEQTKNQEGV